MVTSRLDFFPASLIDETLHSRLSRYHSISGNRHDRQSLIDLFGLHTLVIASHLPSHLGRLSARLPADTAYSVNSFIENATLFPYFRPFLSIEQGERCAAALTGDNAGALHMSIGLAAGQVGGHNHFRCCLQCMVDDEKEYGWAYWHRSHMLPGVVICHRHHAVLQALPQAWVQKHRHRLFLPGDCIVQDNLHLITVSESQLPMSMGLADLSAQVLSLPQPSFDRSALRTYYLNLAVDQGLASVNGRLRIVELKSWIQHFLQQLPSTGDFALLGRNESIPFRWVFSLLRRPRTSIHPLKHLLLSLGRKRAAAPHCHVRQAYLDCGNGSRESI